MAPVPWMTIAAFDGQIVSDVPAVSGDEGPMPNVSSVFSNSRNHMKIMLEKVAIKSLTWQKGDGSKLQDQINSTEVRKMTIGVKSAKFANAASIGSSLWGERGPHALNTPHPRTDPVHNCPRRSGIVMSEEPAAEPQQD